MHNLYTIFAKILDICKEMAGNSVNEQENVPRKQYNDRRKYTSSLCNTIRERITVEKDRGEDCFCIDSKPFYECGVLSVELTPNSKLLQTLFNGQKRL